MPVQNRYLNMSQATAKFVLFNGCEDWRLEEIIQAFLVTIEPIATPMISVSSHSHGGRRCYSASISWMDTDPIENTMAKKNAAMAELNQGSAAALEDRIEFHKVLGERPSPASRKC